MACKLQPDQSDDLLYVKKGNVYCGYKREYLAQNLSKMEEGFVACKKCFGIMREASLSKGETTCLVCSDTPRQPNPVKAVQDSIRILGIKCPLPRDCDWKGELSEAEIHLKDCLFFLIQCKKCKRIIPRGDEGEHEMSYCHKRIIRCDYCNNRGKAKHKEEHLQYCHKYPVSCPNECGAKLLRRELSEHRSECELEVVVCPYMEYGCGAEAMLRRALLAHKKEFYIEHQDMSLVQISQSQSEIKQLRELKWKIMSMKQLDGVEWEIKVTGKSEIDGEIEGPTFYVNNYRLRIYCIISRVLFGSTCFLHFYFRRIEGESDKNLGLAYITHYRIIKVNTQDYSESEYKEGKMNYQLNIGTKSEVIKWRKIFFAPNQCLLRFYFDVNSNPLRSLDDDYSNTTPSPPSTPDPWDYYSTSDSD